MIPHGIHTRWVKCLLCNQILHEAESKHHITTTHPTNPNLPVMELLDQEAQQAATRASQHYWTHFFNIATTEEIKKHKTTKPKPPIK